MTDAEIIKALECCQQNTVCVECPMWKKGQNCIEKMCGYALDLINRLQADQEALIAGQGTLQKALAEKIAEVERLKAEADMADGYAEAVEERAIKEFAERLKTEQSFYDGQETRIYLTEKDLDNLVKEMVGDAE